jgi:hypothetical protein
VKPVIAAVLGRRDQLLFTPETAQQLREQSEAGLADVVEQAARDGARPPDRPHQLYLLLALGGRAHDYARTTDRSRLLRRGQRLRSRPALHLARRAQATATHDSGVAGHQREN